MENNIVVIRVHRSRVGTVIPFDKLYLFPKDQRSAIPKVFSFALVLPMEKELLRRLRELAVKSISKKHFKRNDADLNQVPEIDGKAIDGRIHTTTRIGTWWDENIIQPQELENRVVVIPVLGAKHGKKLKPKYLAAARWFTEQEKRNRRSRTPDQLTPAVSENAYLSTPFEKPHHRIRPLCSVCPRALQHLQGECLPGQVVCYSALDLNKIVAPQEPLED